MNMEKRPFYQPPQISEVEEQVSRACVLCVSASQTDIENIDYTDSGIEF